MKRIILKAISFCLFAVVFFAIYYSIIAKYMPSLSSAIMLSLFCALASAMTAMLIEDELYIKRQHKTAIKQAELQMLDRLKVLPVTELSKQISSAFATEVECIKDNLIFCGNSVYADIRKSTPISADDMLYTCRNAIESNVRELTLISLTALTAEAENMLQLSNIRYNIMNKNDLLKLSADLKISNEEIKPSKKLWFSQFASRPKICYTCIKYAVILAVFAIFTRYRALYFSVSAFLLLVALAVLIFRRYRSKKIV